MDTTKTIDSLLKLRKTPRFIQKYLLIGEIARLHHISYYCGMDYASKNFYHFDGYTSRLHHSLNVCNNAYYLTHDKVDALAGLLHDYSTPCFSHVIDYMNKDYITQESTEAKTKEMILNNQQLMHYLIDDNINIDELFKRLDNSIVNNDRPRLCLDRIDGIIIPSLTWLQTINVKEAKQLYKDIIVYQNEDNIPEVSFKSELSIKRIIELNDILNQETHSDYDIYLMDTLGKLVKEMIESKIITYDELYTLTESELVRTMELYGVKHPDFYALWYEFKNASSVPHRDIKVKERAINPILKLDFNQIIRYNN